MKVFILLLLSAVCSYANQKPNVVFIIIDDLGWKDVNYNGSTFYETPCIDALAADSMKFNFYYAASPMCSPTRASIMTGKSPARTGITQWLPGNLNTGGRYDCPTPTQFLKREEVTLGESFQEGGYETCFLGKWHMGPLKLGTPKDHGFDYEGGLIQENGAQMFYPFSRGRKKPLFPGKKGDYFNDTITDHAIKFIKKKKDKPYLLYLSHFAMHLPLASKKELLQKFTEKKEKLGLESKGYKEKYAHVSMQMNQYSPTYAGELANLDENIGRLTDALKESGQYKNTIIIFSGDNGGRSSLNKNDPTSVYPLRGGKTFLYEGGIRTPMFIRWPGKSKVGASSNIPTTSMDFYPSLLEMCGLKLKPQQHKDGVSLVPAFKEEAIERNTLYFHFPHYQREGGSPTSAIRDGNFKLIVNYHYGDVQLFNLGDDPKEKKNLSSSMPEKTEYLKKKIEAYLKESGAKIPVLKNASLGRPSEGKRK